MAPQQLGKLLRTQREHLGLDVDKVASQTNIRPRLLEAFEAGDYGQFPPHGYASGMLSSYARVLQLDPREVLHAYEEELAAYEQQQEMAHEAELVRTGHARHGRRSGTLRHRSKDSAASKTGSLPPVTGEEDTAGDIARATSAVKVVGRKPARSARSRSGASADASRRLSRTRQVADEGKSTLEAYRASMRSRNANADASLEEVAVTGRLSAVKTQRSAEDASDAFDDEALLDDDYEVRGGGHRHPTSRTKRERSRSSRSRRSRYEPTPDENILQRLSGSIRAIFADPHSRLIAIAVILLVLAVIVAASLLISTAGRSDSGILDVHGGNEEEAVTQTQTEDDGTATATMKTASGNPVTVRLEVAEGKTSLITVTYDDDRAYDGTAVGPWSREFDVTETFSVQAGTPSSVSVTANGTAFEIPVNSDDGSGTLTLNIETTGLATSSNGSDDTDGAKNGK